MLSVSLTAIASLLSAFEYVTPLPVLAAAGAAFAGWQSYRQMKDQLRLTDNRIGELRRQLKKAMSGELWNEVTGVSESTMVPSRSPAVAKVQLEPQYFWFLISVTAP